MGTSNSVNFPSTNSEGTKIFPLDIRNSNVLEDLIRTFRPHEIYNLAAISSVSFSFQNPELTREVNFDAFQSLVEICLKFCQGAQIYQASSSEMFGDTAGILIDEETPLNPVSPYAESKALAHAYSEQIRRKGSLWIANGILFNHESPFRSERFVSRKITKAVANIYLGKQQCLSLGNIQIYRDWGHAADYVQAMYKMMQAENPDSYVIATGDTRSLLDFVETAFSCVGITDTFQEFLTVDTSLIRPNDIIMNRANPKKANTRLNWLPNTSFESMVGEMVSFDLQEGK
jgi:GDPmannose 4,6-dehydratase